MAFLFHAGRPAFDPRMGTASIDTVREGWLLWAGGSAPGRRDAHRERVVSKDTTGRARRARRPRRSIRRIARGTVSGTLTRMLRGHGGRTASPPRGRARPKRDSLERIRDGLAAAGSLVGELDELRNRLTALREENARLSAALAAARTAVAEAKSAAESSRRAAAGLQRQLDGTQRKIRNTLAACIEALQDRSPGRGLS